MDTSRKPHSRDKKVAAGSVNARKGGKVQANGPVGSGGRPVSSPRSPRSEVPSGRYPRQGSSSRQPSLSGAAGLISTFKRLPKTLRIIILLALAAFIIFSLIRGSGKQETSAGTYTPDYSAPSYESSPPQSSNYVSGIARDKRYVPLGGGKDTVTVMVFMCGTDLESNYKMATSDLLEMTNATIGSNVNVIVETGGCRNWQNKIVSNSTNQIYKVESGGLRKVADNLGSNPMVDPATLTGFIDYCQENYPADRNILIFWDHGGGSISGYGYDELYKSTGSMDLAEINGALKNADCIFDWIGFDACLMATLETALVCNNYADYLISSEELEPGTGWYYTNWLTALSQNTSISTPELAKGIIDDYVSTSRKASSGAQVTLSLVDLAALEGSVPEAFRRFSSSTMELLNGNEYALVSNARANTRQFAKSNMINQIDLVDFAERIGTEEALTLAATLRSCVTYNSSTISRANGLSIYFPYESTSSMSSAVATYNSIGIDSEYTKCIKEFATTASSGQLASAGGTSFGSSYSGLGSLLGSGSLGSLDLGSLLEAMGGSGSSSPLGALLGAYTGSSGNSSAGNSIDPSMIMNLLSAFSGRSLPAKFDWVNTDTMARNADFVAENYIDPGEIVETLRSDAERVLSLTGDQWNLIQSVELNVFVDDGEGYIDLGLDNVFEFDGNDLLLSYDGTWLTLNGNLCAYYLVSDTEEEYGSYTTRGRIPALLNGRTVNLEVVFDADHPDGFITGARPIYEDETDVLAKGDIPIVSGDTIQLLCDYYTYDGDYDSTYELGDAFTVDGLPELVNMYVDEACSVTYRLTDIYSNHYWTPAWTYGG